MVEWCLKKDPEERPQSADALLRRLEEVADTGSDLGADGPKRNENLFSARPPHSRTKRLKWLLAGAASVAAVALLLFLARPGNQNSDAREDASLSALGPSQAAIEKSIAVLPLESISPDPANAFFADGVQDDIIMNLAKIGELTVIARPSTLRFRDSQDLSEIAKELSVNHLVTGTVRRSGNQVRVSVQLIDPVNDNQVEWADAYGGPLDDIFEIQSSIAKEVAGQLKAAILPEEIARIERRPTQNQQAYDYFLQARSGFSTMDRPLLEKAVGLDPNFADAWAVLAASHINYWRNGNNRNDPGLLEQAKFALQQAQQTGPDLPHLPWAKSYFAWHEDLDEEASIQYLLDALTIDPGFYPALKYIGWKYLQVGRRTEAEYYTQQAHRIDPFSNFNGTAHVKSCKRSGEWEKAEQWVELQLKYDPNSILWQWHSALLQFQKVGNPSAYIENLESNPVLKGDSRIPFLHALRARLYREALEALNNVKDESFRGYVPLFAWNQVGAPFHKQSITALLWFQLGETEKYREAFELLESQLTELAEIDPNANPDCWAFLAVCHAMEGDRDQMEKMIRKTREQTNKEYFRYRFQQGCEMIISLAYLALGEKDNAIEILEDASQLDGWPFMNRELEFWFMFDPLRGDPRFEKLLED